MALRDNLLEVHTDETPVNPSQPRHSITFMIRDENRVSILISASNKDIAIYLSTLIGTARSIIEQSNISDEMKDLLLKKWMVELGMCIGEWFSDEDEKDD